MYVCMCFVFIVNIKLFLLTRTDVNARLLDSTDKDTSTFTKGLNTEFQNTQCESVFSPRIETNPLTRTQTLTKCVISC